MQLDYSMRGQQEDAHRELKYFEIVHHFYPLPPRELIDAVLDHYSNKQLCALLTYGWITCATFNRLLDPSKHFDLRWLRWSFATHAFFVRTGRYREFCHCVFTGKRVVGMFVASPLTATFDQHCLFCDIFAASCQGTASS